MNLVLTRGRGLQSDVICGWPLMLLDRVELRGGARFVLGRKSLQPAEDSMEIPFGLRTAGLKPQ